MSSATAPTTLVPGDSVQPAPALPRLLAGVSTDGAMTLARHVRVHGELRLPTRRARQRAAADGLIEETRRASLLGRGGGAFPTAVKMRAVLDARGHGRTTVVVNAAEGEPASRKDRTLLEHAPHLVLDGGLAAACTVSAEEVILCVNESATAAIEASARAVSERDRPSARSPKLRLHIVPDHYVAGQESALVSHLGGAPARPTFTPPLPSQRGVARRPTLVDNAETLAHLALIARHGASWYRQLGTPTQPGSTLLTLSGPVARPGVYEIEHGTSLSSLLETAGGLTERVCGALLGGYGGSWVGGEKLRGLAFSNEHLAPLGAGLGPGVVQLLSELACPVAETVRLSRWLAGQSTRQCGPCVNGLDAVARTVEQLARGSIADGEERLRQLVALISRRGACALPDGATRVLLSSLRAFAPQFAEHARHGPCEACERPAELPLPAAAWRAPHKDRWVR